MRLVAILVAVTVSAAPAVAAEGPLDDLGPAATDALQSLRDAARDRVLVGDLMGAEVDGPSGEALGTVRNLAAIPGGRLVAVVIELPDGERVAVPWQLVSLSRTADAVGLSVPVRADALLENQAVKEMSDLLGL